MRNTQDLKQSKISRHENAKQKFRFFERSHSTKSFNNKKEFVPVPGQFAILGNKKQRQSNQLPSLKIQQGGQSRQQGRQGSLKFTTNLKLITRQRSPSRVSQVLNETVNKKVTQQQSFPRKLSRPSSSTTIRPHTAVISSQLVTDLQGKSSIQQSPLVLNAMEYDKKYYIKKQLTQGNSFVVKSRSTIPKHVYGFKSIRLTQDDTMEKKLKIDSQNEIKHDGRRFSKMPIEVKQKQHSKHQQQQSLAVDNKPTSPNFLPIEYYMMDDMLPQQLMQKYSMKDNYMMGYSKWQNVQGNYEWRKCRVIGYIKEKQRWEIQWLHNGKRKIVGRNNLYFQKEDFQHFQMIIHNAEEFRKRSEIFMKYNWIIDNMTTQTHQIQDNQLNSIIRLLGKFVPVEIFDNNLQALRGKPYEGEGKKTKEKLANRLINEVREKYIRANHAVQFHSSLPYSIKYKQQFRGYLPQSYFTPNSSITKFTLTTKHQLSSQKKIHSKKAISDDQGSQKLINLSTSVVHTSSDMKKLFDQGQKKFLKITALTSIYRIQIIEFLNKSEVAIVNLRVPPAYDITYSKDQVKLPENQLKYFPFYSNKLYDLQQVQKKLQDSLFDSLTRMNTIVCEVQYCISKQMDPIYLDRKTVGYNNFDDMVDHYRRFLMTVNMRIQKMGKSVLLGIMSQLTDLLRGSQQLLGKKQTQQYWKSLENEKTSHRQLKIKIVFELKAQTLQCTPSMETVISWLQSYGKKVIESFGKLSCIRKSYIDQLRPSNKMKICETLYQDTEGNIIWKQNPQLISAKIALSQVIQQCKEIFSCVFKKVKEIVDKVIGLQTEIRKKNWKKCSFGEIQQYKRVISEVKGNLIRLKMLSLNSTLIFNPNNNIKKNHISAAGQLSQQSATKTTSERSMQSIKTNIAGLNAPSSRQPQHQPQLQQEMAIIQSPQQSSQRTKFQHLLQSTLQPHNRFIKAGAFIFQLDQVLIKIQLRLIQLQKQLYKLLVQKIYRQSQKIQKQLQMIKQKVEEQPKNIRQMIQLQHYLNEEAQLQLNKVINKMIQIQHNFTLIQTTQLDYKDFYDCHKVILKPLKIRTLMTQKLILIDSQYKKKFGQQLMREVASLSHEMREIEQKFYITIAITSLEQMNASFMTFSKLKERIQNALAKSIQVNDYQTAMKWINTSFQRLVEIKDQFMPYYQLITLSKNYNFHLTLQINQPLHTIDAKKIAQDVLNAINELVVLEFQTFAKHQVMLEIVRKVAGYYKMFKEKLPLMQILRNPDLRERHWNSIKELTTYNDILSDKITFAELEQRGIKKYQKKLIQISHIATRELIYEKKLNKMKKEWKELKIQTKIIPSLQKPTSSENNNTTSTANDIRVICNADEIKTKTQNDIYQIQEILASSFIKFLQKDVLFWRNHTLYKMYEFIEIWKIIEKQFVPYWKMFSRSAIKNQAPNEYQKFKALEKNWRNLTQTIEQQPNVLELLQTKINDSIKYTVELIDDLKKAVTEFFETKKQKFSRFGALSQDQLIALYSNSTEETEVFDQAVRKCLQGVKGVVRDDKSRITMVKTHLDEEINLNNESRPMGKNEQEDDDLSPDKIIEDIEKKIKRSLRISIDKIEQKSAKILQIVLFHQRVVFTREIESQLFGIDNDDGPGIQQGYLNALVGLKSQIISVLLGVCNNKGSAGKNRNNPPKNLIKIQAELNQLINHSEIAEWLYRKNVTETFDFEWISQIRTYHNSGSYSIHCGLNKTEYGFEITDQQNYIVERSSMRTFCHLSMATTQRMFSILSGKIGEGKLSSLHYLANIHGRNQLVMGCHQAISYDNIIDSFRMCANGIWIVFNNLNLLTPQVLSVFAQALQLLWINYPTQRSKGYITLGQKNVMFTTHQINLFAKINTNKTNLPQFSHLSSHLSTYFRTYSVIPLDVQYILQVKLILAGFKCSNPSRFFHMIELIQAECDIFYKEEQQQGVKSQGELNFSKLNFVQKAIKYAKQFKQKSYMTERVVEEFIYLQQGLQKAITDISMNLPQLKSQILSKLSQYFDFLPHQNLQLTIQSSLMVTNNNKTLIQQQGSEQQNIRQKIKKLFIQNKLYGSRYTIQKYWSILTTLQQKHSVIILGQCSTGKSQLITLLGENRIKLRRKFSLLSGGLEDEYNYIDGFKIQLTYLHPNAYSLTELFGDVNKNGVINSLIKKAYQRLDSEKGKEKKQDLSRRNSSTPTAAIQRQQQHSDHPQPFTNLALVFDSQISAWIQPLLPLIKSNNTYIQPNGKTVIIQHPLKLIFQCRNLATVSPSIILATNIVHLDNKKGLKWQHMFVQYLRVGFSQEQFKQKMFLEYCQALVTFVLEPVLEFVKSSVTNFNAKMNTTTTRLSKTIIFQQNAFLQLIYNSFLRNQANIIPLVFNLFIALVQSHYQSILENQSNERKNKQRNSAFSSLITMDKEPIEENNLHSFLDDKNRSVVFNLFIMAITWTIGLIIPEESKKTFSRHFKYLIKRSIQLNIKNIEKDSLPKDQEDIYELCFSNDKWYTWEEIITQRTKNKMTISESINFSMTNQDRDSVPMKAKFKYIFLFETYAKARQPFFLLGKSSTGKNSLMLDFISHLPQQTYNYILLTCTPQTTHKHTKYQLKKQIQQQKYSHKYQGFVNGKCKIFYLCDMNLPLKKNEYSLNEFVYEYVKSQGWYLNSSAEFFKFRNLAFCGTLNSVLSCSQQLIRFINPICYIECENDIKSTLFSILNSNNLIHPYSDKLVKLMINLQQVIGRQFRHLGIGRSISFRDQCDIAQNLRLKITNRLFDDNGSNNTLMIKKSQMSLKILLQTSGSGGGTTTSNSSNETLQREMKNKILQCWIIQSQQKYQEVIGPQYDHQKIYYFINNVLMEEQRLRYKTILPKNDYFLSNISYYASRITNTDNKLSTNKKLKTTKPLQQQQLMPNSYRIYDSLPSIKQQIQNVQNFVNRTFTKLQQPDHLQKRFSFAKQIRLATSNKKHPQIAISYLRSMQCMLDYFLEEHSKLIVFVNENNKIGGKIYQKEQIGTTVKEMFQFNSLNDINSVEEKQDKNRKQQHQSSQLQRLFRFTANILKSHVVQFQHQNSSYETRTQWKLFLSQLFQLINSPLSSNLNDYYVVYIKDIKDSEYFILQQFLGLIRMGVLKVLEDYINSEEFETEEIGKSEIYQKTIENQPTQMMVENDSVIYEESIDQSQHSVSEEIVQKKRIEEQNKRIQEMRKMNIAQLMRQKVLRKIKFVIELNEDKMQKLKQNYSVLFEKSHILWSSQLLSTPTKRITQIDIKDSQRQLSSVVSVGSRRSLTSQIGIHNNNDEIKNILKQNDFTLITRKQYHNHKQSLTHVLSFNEIKRVYLSLLEETNTNIKMIQIEREIQSGQNVQFLQFLNLRKYLQQGIQIKVQQMITNEDLNLQYITTLSSTLLQQMLTRIAEQNTLIQTKENQLELIAKQIQQLSDQNQKFVKLFLNLQNSLNLLENQSRQNNDLYHQAIGKQEKNFLTAQLHLVDLLKTAKDKKIFMTNQMKAFLELFGLVINKKLKPEQSMVKEIVRDIGALKVHKKVTNVFVQPPIGQKLGQKQSIINEKAVRKLKQFVTKNLIADLTKYIQMKQQYSYSKDKIKQSSFSQNLLNLLKDYLIFFLIFFNKTQQEGVQQLNKKCTKILKQLTKTKEQLNKLQKNKNYQKITNDLDELKKKRSFMLQSYDQQHKYLQSLLSIHKKSLEVNSLSINGQIDQTIIAIKSSLETLVNFQSSERSKNLVIQRIKDKFYKEKQNLIPIRNCMEMISLLITCRFKINQLQIEDIKMGNAGKIVSREMIEMLGRFKIPVWDQLFPETNKKIHQDNQKNTQKPDIVRYFIQEFDLKKTFKLLNGIVITSNQYLSQWLKKSQLQRLFSYNPNLNIENIVNVLKENENLTNNSSLIFHKTAFLTDISSLDEIKQLLLIISQNLNLTKLLSDKCKMIIFIDEEVKQQMSSIQAQKLCIDGANNNLKVNYLQFDNKKSQSQAKMLNLFEQKLEQQLYSDRKENDNKLAIHWRQLKQSQVENEQQMKSLIKSFNLSDTLAHCLCQLQQRQHQSQQSLLEPTNPDPSHLHQQLNRSQHMNKLQAHLLDLKQLFLEHASIQSQLQSIANTSNIKKKSNIFTIKLLKYLARVYEGIEILKSQGLVLNHYSLERFLNIVSDIVRIEKQKQRGQFNQSKLFKCVKNKLFQLITIGENHKKMFVGLIFALSGEDLLTEKEFDKLTRIIIKFFMFSVKMISLDDELLGIESKIYNSQVVSQENNQASKIVKHLVLKRQSLHYPHNDSQKLINSKQQLSQTFEQILQQLQTTFPVFKELKQNIKKKFNLWIKFFIGIENKLQETTLQTLPQPYNDISRGYFGIFVSLLCPSKLQTWIDSHLIDEDLTKISDIEIMSNQTRILSLVNKFNIKQTALIGDESLKLIVSLAIRTRKQLRLYSHLSMYDKQTTFQKDIISSKPVSRRQILQLPQINFFTERKISQEIIDELQNCMKSSIWLVIDLKGLIKQAQSSNEKYTNINFLLKIVDSLTNPSVKSSGRQYSRQNSDHSLRQPLSSPSIQSIEFDKNNFNPASFSSYDYHIFFIVPKSIKRQIFQLTNLSKNSKRFIIELRKQNDLARCFSLNQQYHQQLMMSKKMIKDYQMFNPILKQIIFDGLEIVEYALERSLRINRKGFEFLNLCRRELNIKNSVGLQFNKAKELVDKLSKILMIILQDPDIVKQIFHPTPKTMRKIPLSITQLQPISEKDKIEQKISSRMFLQNTKRKATIKLMLKESLNDNIDIIEKDQPNKQFPSLGSKKNLSNTQSSDKNEMKLSTVLKLIFNYLMSSLDQIQYCKSSLMYYLSKYNNVKQEEHLNNEDQEHNEISIYNNKKDIMKIITNSADPTKTHTTTKSTLQELVELLIQINQKNIKSKQKFLKDQTINTLLLSKSNIQSSKFNNFKFLLERGLQLKREQIHSQQFLNVIQSLNENKKQLETDISEIKTHFFPVTQINNQSQQNQSNNQFNFASLTENLTLQEMRKKLNITDSVINKNANNQAKNALQQNQSLLNLIKLLLRLHSNVVDQIDIKVEKLKNLKTVFLLGNINYQLLKDWWTKNVASHMCTEIVEILHDLDGYKEQIFVNELKKVMQFMINPKRFSIPQFKNLPSEILPIFNLKLINCAAEFEQLIHQLKCTFLETNRLKNQHIKIHFKVEQMKIANKQSLIIQEKKREGKLYKICGFTQFKLSGLTYNQQKSTLTNQTIFIDSITQELNIDHNNNLRLSLCFQVNQLETFTDSDSQIDECEQQQQLIGNEIKQLKIPFFMQQYQRENNKQEEEIWRKVGKVTVDVVRNVDIEKNEKKQIFFVYH